MKDSFILYTEQKETFDKLTNAEAGELIKTIYHYVATGEIKKCKEKIAIAFIPIKQQLDRNEAKWQEIKKKRSQAGKIGMAKRWNSDTITNVTDVITDITNDNKRYQMITKDNKAYQNITKITVNDNVNVNVNDNVNVIYFITKINSITVPLKLNEKLKLIRELKQDEKYKELTEEEEKYITDYILRK